MNQVKSLILFVLLLTVVYGYRGIRGKSYNTIVEGVVVSDNTAKPISRVHVYIVDGEEEAMTNNKGEFRIESTKKFPLTLTAEHEGYEKYRSAVMEAGQKQFIRLKSKS